MVHLLVCLCSHGAQVSTNTKSGDFMAVMTLKLSHGIPATRVWSNKWGRKMEFVNFAWNTVGRRPTQPASIQILDLVGYDLQRGYPRHTERWYGDLHRHYTTRSKCPSVVSDSSAHNESRVHPDLTTYPQAPTSAVGTGTGDCNKLIRIHSPPRDQYVLVCLGGRVAWLNQVTTPFRGWNLEASVVFWNSSRVALGAACLRMTKAEE
ncbi:hypothetical protein RSAG8_00066, partial [Rhizoctonia solani AG-8 WAC10335]